MSRFALVFLGLSSLAHAAGFEVLYLGAGTVELETDPSRPPVELARCTRTGDMNLGPPDFTVNHFTSECWTDSLVTQPSSGRWAATMSVGAQTEKYMPQNVKFFLNDEPLGSFPNDTTLILWGTHARLDGWVVQRKNVDTFQTFVPRGFDERGEVLYLDQLDRGPGAVWKVDLGSRSVSRVVSGRRVAATPLAVNEDFIDERALRGPVPTLPEGARHYEYLRLDARRILYYRDAPKLPVPAEARSTGYDHESYCDPKRSPSSWHIFDLVSGDDQKVLDDDACRGSRPYSVDGLLTARDGWALLRQPRPDQSIVTWRWNDASHTAEKLSDQLPIVHDVRGSNLLGCKYGECGVFDRELRLVQKVAFEKHVVNQTVRVARLLKVSNEVAAAVDLQPLFAGARSQLHRGPPGSNERDTLFSTLSQDALWSRADGQHVDESGLLLEVKSSAPARHALREGESFSAPLTCSNFRVSQLTHGEEHDIDCAVRGSVRYMRVGDSIALRIDAELRSGARLEGWEATVEASGF